MLELRPYQVAAADKLEVILRERRIAYLSGEPRCGKSLTGLSLAQRFKAGGSILVVTKKKAIKSIQKDALNLLGEASQFVEVINYEQLHKYVGRSYMMVIVDEAHSIGAYARPSQRFKNLRRINAALWLLMSATPSPESLSQLYHQYALGNGPWKAYRNFYAWAKDYVIVSKKRVAGGTLVDVYNNAIASKVMPDVEPYAVTITQKQAGFETVIEEHLHFVMMKPRTYRIAQRILKDAVLGTVKGRAIVADTGAKQASKLQQVYGGAVIAERKGETIPVKFDRSKVEYIQRTFTGKIAILYRFVAEGDMLREAYGDRATDSPEVFNSIPDSVFIGQVQSSREGVNLSSCDDLIFLGIDFASLSYSQARQRGAFLGRSKPNRVHWIFADGGMENDIYNVVKDKQTFTDIHFKRFKKKSLKFSDQLAILA